MPVDATGAGVDAMAWWLVGQREKLGGGPSGRGVVEPVGKYKISVLAVQLGVQCDGREQGKSFSGPV